MRLFDFDEIDCSFYNISEDNTSKVYDTFVNICNEDLLVSSELVCNPQKFTINKIPEVILDNNKDTLINVGIDKEYFDKISMFLDYIHRYLPGVNVSAFYENIKTFEIKKVKRTLKNFRDFQKYKATYVSGVKDNKILFYNCDVDSVIYHELLHMASKRSYKNGRFIGFNQIVDNYEIGEGLNEGYTDLLSVRYFSSLGSKPCNYYLERYISELIEFIVGRENMEKWYFNSDLYSLAQSLKSYLKNDDIILLISIIDKIFRRFNNPIFSKQVNKLYREVTLLLVNIILQKYILMQENGCTCDELKEFKDKFFNLVSRGYEGKDSGMSSLMGEDVWYINQKIIQIDQRYIRENNAKYLTKL